MKRLTLAASLLKEDLGHIVLMLFEMVAGVLALGAFLSCLYTLFSMQKIYSELKLDHVIYYTGNRSYGEELREVVSQEENLTYLTEVLSGMRLDHYYNDYAFQFYGVEEEYLRTFNQMQNVDIDALFEEHKDENIVFLSPKLKGEYHAGSTYTFELLYGSGDKSYEIEALVGGFIDGDLNFWPEQHQSHFISRDDTANLLYCGRDTQLNEKVRNAMWGDILYVVYETDMEEMDKHLERLGNLRGTYCTLEEMYKERIDDTVTKMRTPLLIAIAALTLFVVAFSSHGLICIYRREKQYGLFFMHGASWKDCLIIQFIGDMIILGTLYVLSFGGFLALASAHMDFETIVNAAGMTGAVFICSLMYLLFSAMNIRRLRKQEPIQIIRRWL